MMRGGPSLLAVSIAPSYTEQYQIRAQQLQAHLLPRNHRLYVQMYIKTLAKELLDSPAASLLAPLRGHSLTLHADA